MLEKHGCKSVTLKVQPEDRLMIHLDFVFKSRKINMEVNLKKQEHLKLFAFLFVPLLSLIYDLENIGSLLTLEL